MPPDTPDTPGTPGTQHPALIARDVRIAGYSARYASRRASSTAIKEAERCVARLADRGVHPLDAARDFRARARAYAISGGRNVLPTGEGLDAVTRPIPATGALAGIVAQHRATLAARLASPATRAAARAVADSLVRPPAARSRLAGGVTPADLRAAVRTGVDAGREDVRSRREAGERGLILL